MTEQHIDPVKHLASVLDLTSLNENDTDEVISKLCERARTFHVAAVCVYPKFVRVARDQLAEHSMNEGQRTGQSSKIRIATVANFPSGEDDLEATISTIKQAVNDGADEIDIVLPYRKLLAGEVEYCRNYLESARKASHGFCLKVIIESGELKDEANIELATKLAIESGANFVKTSTGKSKISATPEAVACMLKVINEMNVPCGVKVSGGVRTVKDGLVYLKMVNDSFGKTDMNNFRIGASSLLDDIARHLNPVNQAGPDQVNEGQVY